MNRLSVVSVALLCLVSGCPSVPPPEVGPMDDGPIAEGIAGSLGDPIPSATPEELALFERGKAVLTRTFDLVDGLGPAFNLTSCGGCHERPTPGGSSGLYRNFFLAASVSPDGTFTFSQSAGMAGGVHRVFNYGPFSPARPALPADANLFAQRHAIPMFGMGLIAELSDDEILSRADETDADGDGISGRVNIDRGAVGRFGRKAQTVSLEGFVRGPLFNHMGITTSALSDAQRAEFPIKAAAKLVLIDVEKRTYEGKGGPHMQIAITDAQTVDSDGIPDPELSTTDLFDLVSFAMLTAAPKFDTPTVKSNRGRLLFHEANCSACHVPRLAGPRGPVPLYSDLLLHDMGEDLADGIVMLQSTGSEFRTQPLWGLAAVGPYLHDGRAETLEAAILAHGGEAQASQDAFANLTDAQRGDVIEFLLSLGGRDQYSAGLVPPNTPIPAVGDFGGPLRSLTADEQQRFLRGREVFDRDFGESTGVGAMTGADGGPRFNGDSCRACHSIPVIGGAGARDVNVMRHGRLETDGSFTAPVETPNTILHKQIRVGFHLPGAETGINVFEHRQTPHTFGMGLIDAITGATIRSHADPDDADGDEVSGRVHELGDGRIGRLGWKAQVPSVAEFVRDAMAAEIGVTLPPQTGLTFGLTQDGDGVADPELDLAAVEDMAFFMSVLAGPPRRAVQGAEAQTVARGGSLFESVGCAKCHIPSLPSSLGEVPLFSDLLLHEALAPGTAGIADGDASPTEFRTAPLWGLSQTAPYLHDGSADTIDQAIRSHNGEAVNVRAAFLQLSREDQAALLAFLGTL